MALQCVPLALNNSSGVELSTIYNFFPRSRGKPCILFEEHTPECYIILQLFPALLQGLLSIHYNLANTSAMMLFDSRNPSVVKTTQLPFSCTSPDCRCGVRAVRIVSALCCPNWWRTDSKSRPSDCRSDSMMRSSNISSWSTLLPST